MVGNKLEDNDVLEMEESELFQDDEEHEAVPVESPDVAPHNATASEARKDEDEPDLPFPEQEDEEDAEFDRKGEEEGEEEASGNIPGSIPGSIPVPVQSATLPELEQSTETASSSQNNKCDDGESCMGSLKTFANPSQQGLPFNKRMHSSEGDLSMAASLPAGPIGDFSSLAFKAKSIKTNKTLTEEDVSAATTDAYLGTSMPIRIPIMSRHRRKVSVTGSLEGRPATFIPPHLMESHAGPTNFAPGSVLTPSAAVKREKLMARNAILRSTGFIEVQNFAAPMSQVIDAVKETVISGAGANPTVLGESSPMPTDAVRRPSKAASSLTALLGN